MITDEFMKAVEARANWVLAFPLDSMEAEEDAGRSDRQRTVVWRDWPVTEGYITDREGRVACKVYGTLPARELFDLIMQSTYDFAEPGFILIDRVNEMNNNWYVENIRATNPCGEQPLPPYGACLLGSVNLTRFVREPFTRRANFDWDEFNAVVAIFTRMLDNVVEINGLPLETQVREILRKRRHGMGFLGLGSTLPAADALRSEDPPDHRGWRRELAVTGWRVGWSCRAVEGRRRSGRGVSRDPAKLRRAGRIWPKAASGPAQAARQGADGALQPLQQRVAGEDPELVEELPRPGARLPHHSSIAPTGTISLSLGNNASNGIEPSFAHHYFRNVIREGRKSKEKVPVYSYELLAYRQQVNPEAGPEGEGGQALPKYFITADDVSPSEHVAIQGAAQKWVDSSISKTANVPSDYPYERFKDIYVEAWKRGLKGCTTFRFNPTAFQGVLVKEKDLKSTFYVFKLEDGSEVKFAGDEEVEYDGQVHTAANLFDALKEGYYGKF